MRYLGKILLSSLISIGLLGFFSPASAQLKKLKDKIKDKTEQKAEEKVDEEIDKALDKAAGEGEEQEKGQEAEAEEESKPAQTKGGSATAEDMALYTKYDFIPGDKVIFYDDLSGEELGEFPSRWKLDRGVFEIVKQYGQNWIMCTDKGSIRPKIPAGPLPDKYTVEMDFYNKGGEARGHWYYLEWLDAEGEIIGSFRIQDKIHTNLRIFNDDLASKSFPKEIGPGKHTMRIMATKTTIKCYVDNERMANVPMVEGFAPAGLQVTMDPYIQDEEGNPMLIGTFRYAEGGKTMKQQLDETGKIITHGILFDSGSDKIKAESYKTLADIGQLLTENPELRLSVEGHTDSDGADDYNLGLSQRRSAAIRTYLMDAFKINGERLETKGFGETKPIDSNDTPEGKANNRRVELIKL